MYNVISEYTHAHTHVYRFRRDTGNWNGQVTICPGHHWIMVNSVQGNSHTHSPSSKQTGISCECVCVVESHTHSVDIETSATSIWECCYNFSTSIKNGKHYGEMWLLCQRRWTAVDCVCMSGEAIKEMAGGQLVLLWNQDRCDSARDDQSEEPHSQIQQENSLTLGSSDHIKHVWSGNTRNP